MRLVAALALLASACALERGNALFPAAQPKAVSVQLGTTVFMGSRVPTSNAQRHVDAYTGLAYAQPAAKFARPEPVELGKAGGPRARGLLRFVEGRGPGAVCPSVGQAFDMPDFLRHVLDADAASGGRPDAAACRTLDVYVPADRGTRVLPVLVFLHGGLGESGSRLASISAGGELLRFRGHDYVVVAVEYSLGPLGFWHDGTDGTKDTVSNSAIRDVLLALQWVQRAIGAFGGDAKRVTLVGHSAGASLAHHVHLALGDLAACGLSSPPIARLMLFSGTALMLPAVPEREAHARQRQFAAHVPSCRMLVFAGAPMAEVTRCVSRLSDDDVLAATREAGVVWTPVVDGILLKDETARLVDADAGQPSVSILMTATTRETSLYAYGPSAPVPLFVDGQHFAHAMCAPREVQDEIVRTWPESLPEESVDVSSAAFFLAPIARVLRAARSSGRPAAFHTLAASLDRIGPSSFAWYAFESLSGVLVSAVGPMMRRALSVLAPRLLATVDAMAAVRARLDDIARLGPFHGVDQLLLFNAPIARGDRTGTLRFGLLANPDDNDAPAVLGAFVMRGTLPDGPDPGPFPPVLDRVAIHTAYECVMRWKRTGVFPKPAV